jgi:hypothetical protein
LFVLHRCDNRGCVNPAHLFLGTNTDNVRDMVAKGRDRLIGERAPHAILTSQQVREIRRSSESDRVLARHFNSSRETIRDARRRKNWRHVL